MGYNMFKNRIREMRKKRNMTIQELADKIGRGFSTVQKLDTGTVDLDTYWMGILAEALDCEPWELLPLEMQPKISPEDLELLRLLKNLRINKNDTPAKENKAG